MRACVSVSPPPSPPPHEGPSLPGMHTSRLRTNLLYHIALLHTVITLVFIACKTDACTLRYSLLHLMALPWRCMRHLEHGAFLRGQDKQRRNAFCAVAGKAFHLRRGLRLLPYLATPVLWLQPTALCGRQSPSFHSRLNVFFAAIHFDMFPFD